MKQGTMNNMAKRPMLWCSFSLRALLFATLARVCWKRAAGRSEGFRGPDLACGLRLEDPCFRPYDTLRKITSPDDIGKTKMQARIRFPRSLRLIYSECSPYTSISGVRQSVNLDAFYPLPCTSRISSSSSKLLSQQGSQRIFPITSWPYFCSSWQLSREIFLSTVCYQMSTLPSATKNWNALPDLIVSINNTNIYAVATTISLSNPSIRLQFFVLYYYCVHCFL